MNRLFLRALRRRVFSSAGVLADRFRYRLPTVLVAFPRSGSNFLQRVVETSSGLTCQSLYALPHRNPEALFNVKSHALSYAHLLDESTRLVGNTDAPAKIIVLQRDPRDVVISFYEFVQARKKIDVSQEEFFHHICFFWATYLSKDRVLERTVELEPLSIADAIQRHVRNWFEQPVFEGEILRVHYERLVTDPQTEFERIFRFLELDCALAQNSLGEMVSQYSKTNRSRGVPLGWRNKTGQYSVLLSIVNNSIAPTIRFLGYEL